MYCQKCGKQIQDNSPKCPYCSEPVVQNTNVPKKANPTVIYLLFAVVIIALISIIVLLLHEKSNKPQEDISNYISAYQQVEENPTAVYEDKYIKAQFIKVYNEKGIDGAAYLQLHVENKSNQTLTVSLTNAAINGMSTTIGSGVPMTITPGNASEQPFIIFTKNTGVENAEQINKLQFSFYILSEDTNLIEETEVITINVNSTADAISSSQSSKENTTLQAQTNKTSDLSKEKSSKRNSTTHTTNIIHEKTKIYVISTIDNTTNYRTTTYRNTTHPVMTTTKRTTTATQPFHTTSTTEHETSHISDESDITTVSE